MPPNESETSLGDIGRPDEDLDVETGHETPEVTLGGLDALLGILSPQALGDALQSAGYDAEAKVNILVDIAKAKGKGALKAIECLDETIKTALRMAGKLNQIRVTTQGVGDDGLKVTSETDMEQLVKEQRGTFAMLQAAQGPNMLIDLTKENQTNGEDSEAGGVEGGRTDGVGDECVVTRTSDPFTLIRRPANRTLGGPKGSPPVREGSGEGSGGQAERGGPDPENPPDDGKGPVVSPKAGIGSKGDADPGLPLPDPHATP